MDDFNTARDYVNHGEYQKAIPKLEGLLKNSNIVENHKNLCMVENMRALCLINLNEINMAKGILEEILNIEPENIMAKSNLKAISKSLLSNLVKEADEATKSEKTWLSAKEKYKQILSELNFKEVERRSDEDSLYTHIFYNYIHLLGKLKEDIEALKVIETYLLFFNRNYDSEDLNTKEDNIKKKNEISLNPPLHMLELISSICFKVNNNEKEDLIEKVEYYLVSSKQDIRTMEQRESYFSLAFNFSNFYFMKANYSECLQKINLLIDEVKFYLGNDIEQQKIRYLKEIYLRAVYLQSTTLAKMDQYYEAFEASKTLLTNSMSTEELEAEVNDKYIESSLNYALLYAQQISERLTDLERENVKETNDKSIPGKGQSSTNVEQKESVYVDICDIYEEILEFYTSKFPIITDKKYNAKLGCMLMKLHYNYSIILVNRKNTEKAINHLQTVLNFFNGLEKEDIEENVYFNSISNLSFLQVQKKQYMQAFNLLEDFLRQYADKLKQDISKKDILIHILKNASSAAMYIPNFTVAIMRLSEVLELIPDDQNVRNALEACQQQVVYLASLGQEQEKKSKRIEIQDKDEDQRKEAFTSDKERKSVEEVSEEKLHNEDDSDKKKTLWSRNQLHGEKLCYVHKVDPIHKEETDNDFEEYQALCKGLNGQEYTIHSYEDLIWPAFFDLNFNKKIPANKREMYLSNSDFAKYFKGMDHEEFYNLPKWRRDLMKRSVKLF